MAKIQVVGVERGTKKDTITIILVETIGEGKEAQEIALGKASVEFATGTTLADMKQPLIESAKNILAKHKEAQALRKQFEQQEFPEVE